MSGWAPFSEDIAEADAPTEPTPENHEWLQRKRRESKRMTGRTGPDAKASFQRLFKQINVNGLAAHARMIVRKSFHTCRSSGQHTVKLNLPSCNVKGRASAWPEMSMKVIKLGEPI